ncbi:transposase [Thermus thermophilus]|nr:transposase [Thermus thermophilus]
MWIEEGFRDLKGQGFGLDRHRLRTGASLRGWLWLLALGMALLVLLGARLQGREWLPRLLAHPERQSLFRLGRIALAQGPPPWREAVVEELVRLLQELGEESDESSGRRRGMGLWNTSGNRNLRVGLRPRASRRRRTCSSSWAKWLHVDFATRVARNKAWEGPFGAPTAAKAAVGYLGGNAGRARLRPCPHLLKG